MKLSKNTWMTWLIQLNLQISNSCAFDSRYYHLNGDRNDTGDFSNHAQTYTLSKGSIPKSLCRFFWTLVLAIAIVPFNIPGILIGLFNPKIRKDPAAIPLATNAIIWPLIQLVGMVILDQIFEFFSMPMIETYGWMQIIGLSLIAIIPMLIGLVIIGGGLVGIVFLVSTCLDKLSERRENKFWADKENKVEPKVKKPNVFIEYIKSKKQKMCPIIEFED